MKKNYHPFTLCIYLLFTLHSFSSISQTAGEQKMQPKVYNYTTFTSKASPSITDELIKLTPKAFQSHPEFGILPYDAPCENCFELIHERKDSSRMFVEKGSNGTHFYSQSIYGIFHYNENGYKISYDPRLRPVSTNLYRSDRQETPAVLNVNDRYSAFEKNGELFKFNNRIDLILVKNNGTTENLGEANWSDHTIGDEGIYITNAWPGIDISISYQLDRIKLNYVIPQQLNYLQGVKNLVFTDHLQLPNGYALTQQNTSDLTAEGYQGKYSINNTYNEEIFTIGNAFGFDQSAIKENHVSFNYLYNGNDLSIVVPVSSWLALPSMVYPVVVDPLVSSSATYTSGAKSFLYNGAWCGLSGSCNYNLNVSRPLNSTITDVRFNAQYISSTSPCSCWRNEAAFKISGPCGVSPAAATTFWNCNSTSAGTCGASGISIFSETSACLTPVCSALLTYQIQNSYCYCSTSGCVASCQSMPNNTWSITVEGHTVETPAPASLNPNPCSGNVTLTAAPSYGVPGYTYVWTTGESTPSISVSSAGTYSVVVTDACGGTANQQFTIACPLSINLKDFGILKVGERVLVKWETLDEVNNDYFTIERMTELPDKWEEIGTVKGSGNSTETIAYTFYDNAPYKRGTSYYRLKQTDFDGQFFYFEPKMMNFGTDTDILIFPQPATHEMVIEWNGYDGEIQLYSVLGEKMEVPYHKKGSSYVFNTSQLSSGMYSVLFLVNGEMIATQKITIK